MVKKRCRRSWVDEDFHNRLKSEASKRGMTLSEFTRQLAKDEDEAFDIFRKKKKSIW